MEIRDVSYEVFQNLLLINNATAAQVSRATGISTGNLSDWKKGRSKPKAPSLQKIADYFGVSLDYLMTGVEPEPERRLSRAAIEFGEEMDKRPQMRRIASLLPLLSDEEMFVVQRLCEVLTRNRRA